MCSSFPFACVLACVLATNLSRATVVIPPAPAAYPTNSAYQVLVNGHACPVLDTRVFFELKNPDRVVAWSQFDFTGKVNVEVVTKQKIQSVRIRPFSAGVKHQIKGSALLAAPTREALHRYQCRH